MTGEFSTDLAVRRLGRAPGEAPTLFFLHGLTDSGTGWPGAVAHWGTSYSIVSVDQRGHGDSPRFTEEQLAGHPGDLMVEDAIALLEQLGESPVIVGHSLGGAVALAVAVRRPDLVRALVLEDPAPLADDEEQRDAERGRQWVDGVRPSLDVSDDDELLEVRRRAHPDWPEDELLPTGRAEQQTDLDFLAVGEIKPSVRVTELFKELIVPALVVSGDAGRDDICITSDIERVMNEVGNPNLTLFRVTGAGHCIRRERPSEFYACVDDFLGRH